MSVSPPRPKGPPLNALRAFESAARLGGFARAAEELSVTSGAISQHIKALEDWAGAPLFERRSQGVALTALGNLVAGHFSRAFDELGTAVRSLRTHTNQATINIAALPSVAQLWLSPRLPAIRAALTGHKISITALETPPNLYREMFDLSVFLSEPSGRETELILQSDVIFPVCAPEMAMRLKSPTDLLNETWLYDAAWLKDWNIWARQVDGKLVRPQTGPSFSLYAIALEEAKNGAGVLMGHEALVETALQKGDLVAPFSHKALSGKSLNLELAGEFSAASGLKQIVMMLEQ
jgi:LysR family glycine cleavage system transcriptional activator